MALFHACSALYASARHRFSKLDAGGDDDGGGDGAL
jgi:hypothetical protein